MSATERLRATSDLSLQAKTSQSTAVAREAREVFIYRCVVGAWMLTLIGFGILQLMGLVRV